MSAYFQGGGRFEKTLRFLNLLEPDNMVLSLSKISMWGTGAMFLLVIVYGIVYSADMLALFASLGGFSVSGVNYAYRRFKMYEAGHSPYRGPVNGGPS